MDEPTSTLTWPDSALSSYGDMLTVGEVSRVINLGERSVRDLLTTSDPASRLSAVRIGKNWRIPREQLRAYLLAHHNEQAALNPQDDERGTS